jgi:hypothetical protein
MKKHVLFMDEKNELQAKRILSCALWLSSLPLQSNSLPIVPDSKRGPTTRLATMRRETRVHKGTHAHALNATEVDQVLDVADQTYPDAIWRSDWPRGRITVTAGRYMARPHGSWLFMSSTVTAVPTVEIEGNERFCDGVQGIHPTRVACDRCWERWARANFALALLRCYETKWHKLY